MENHEPLGLISLNCRGLGDINKRQKLIGWLNKFQNAARKIILLQETHTTLKTEKQWENDWKDCKIYFSHGDSSSRGVATIIPKNMDYKVIEIITSSQGRYVATIVEIAKNITCIINCYAPCTNKPKDQLKWLDELQEIITKYSNTNIIIGGDLNDCFIPILDKYRCKPRTLETEYVKAWKTLCEEMGLIDIWRVLNPEVRRYTWRQGSSASRLKQSRLDYWLVSVHMVYDLNTVDIKASTGSDHSLIDINFYKTETAKRGPSFWRFNTSLLQEEKYVNQIKLCYNEALNKYNDTIDKGLKWDLIKMDLRLATINYSKIRAKESRENIKETV
jgi:exonuclease III